MQLPRCVLSGISHNTSWRKRIGTISIANDDDDGSDVLVAIVSRVHSRTARLMIFECTRASIESQTRSKEEESLTRLIHAHNVNDK